MFVNYLIFMFKKILEISFIKITNSLLTLACYIVFSDVDDNYRKA